MIVNKDIFENQIDSFTHSFHAPSTLSNEPSSDNVDCPIAESRFFLASDRNVCISSAMLQQRSGDLTSRYQLWKKMSKCDILFHSHTHSMRWFETLRRTCTFNQHKNCAQTNFANVHQWVMTSASGNGGYHPEESRKITLASLPFEEEHNLSCLCTTLAGLCKKTYVSIGSLLCKISLLWTSLWAPFLPD